MEELKWQPESSWFESWRGLFTGNPTKSSSLQSSEFEQFGRDEQCWNSEWQSSPSASRSVPGQLGYKKQSHSQTTLLVPLLEIGETGQ